MELRPSRSAFLSESARVSLGESGWGCGGIPYIPQHSTEQTLQQSLREFTLGTGGSVAEIRIEEKKRGAPWMLILLLLVVAAIIGWWLWSNRSSGTETTGAPAATVADSVADTTRTP